MKQKILLAVIFGSLLQFGCDHHHDHSESSHGTNDHGHSHGDGHDDHHSKKTTSSGAHGHGHGEHEGASEVVTLWGNETQLFVEFPALVKGEDSPFAAHLTRIRDHLAVSSGKVVVELSEGGHPLERFDVERPSVAGIFRPVIRPMYVGVRRVTLRLESNQANETHQMGEFEVYSSRKEADAASGEDEEGSDEISYLLEEQWKVAFRLGRVQAKTMRPNFKAFAELRQPADAESLVTAPRDGRVLAANNRFPLLGEAFNEGDLLFRLSAALEDGGDPATLDLALEQAQIQVNSTRREVQRISALVTQGVISQRRLDVAQSELATAEAALRSAKRRRASLSQTQSLGGGRDALGVPTPLSGAIAEIFVAPGAWVSEGDRLARVVNRDRLVLTVDVPEAYVGRLKDISGAWFKLNHVLGTFEVARDALISVGTEIHPDTRTLPVRFGIDNIRRELFAGMKTQAHLIADQPQLTTAIPESALVDDSGVDVVYVQSGGESFERRPVRIGIRDGDYVEVLDGVRPGEWIVERGAYLVKLASSSTDAIGHGHAH